MRQVGHKTFTQSISCAVLITQHCHVSHDFRPQLLASPQAAVHACHKSCTQSISGLLIHTFGISVEVTVQNIAHVITKYDRMSAMDDLAFYPCTRLVMYRLMFFFLKNIREG